MTVIFIDLSLQLASPFVGGQLPGITVIGAEDQSPQFPCN